MAGTEIILVRHGESEWNAIGRYQGQLDIALSSCGKEQAAQTGAYLAGEQIDAVISSPLSRARDTAEAIAGPHGLNVEIVPALIEIDHGIWQGLYASEVAERAPQVLKLWKTNPEEVQMPEGECIADIQRRVMPAMEEIITNRLGERVVIVSHDAILRVILLEALGMSMNRFWQISICNASVTRLRYHNGSLDRPQLLSLNETSQLGSYKTNPDKHAL